MGIHIKTKAEIDKMREAGKIHGKILNKLKEYTKIGISTLDLDIYAERLCDEYKVYPVQKDVKGFNHAICSGINNNTVHAIPRSDAIIKDGDIVTLDFIIKKDGYCVDGGTTVAVGNVDAEGLRLINTTKLAFQAGMKAAKPGSRTGDIGHAIYSVAQLAGFDVVTDFVAHGIGKSMHEDPIIPNFGEPGEGDLLKEGMTIALDTLITEGDGDILILEDGWTTKTKDGKRFAFQEHTFVITKDQPEILTL